MDQHISCIRVHNKKIWHGAVFAEWGIPFEFGSFLTDSCADAFQIAMPRFNLSKPHDKSHQSDYTYM